jgi:MFS family permease
MFSSLRIFNYRLWFAGALVSNTGAWMQRTAQDWIVLTELTDYDAAAVGITMALQFGPLLLLMPLAGLMADRFNRRILLMWTQAAQGILGLLLGTLVLFGAAELWHVYIFALLLGIATAIDAPVRQSFVSELVTDKDLPNAVALNATSFQSARLVGPALAGVLVALIGAGPVFVINGLSFAGVIVSLTLIRSAQLQVSPRLPRAKGQIRAGLRYVRSRSDIMMILGMVFLIGTFGFNFPIYIATMATVEYGAGAAEFGVLSSIMAVGAIVGSLLAARREKARLRVVVIAAAAFGLACIGAALTPTYWSFAVALVVVGVSSLTMMNTANAYVQITTAPSMRGRVMALYMAIFAGGTPIGAPAVGWAANTFGPRWAMGIAAASGLLAAGIAVLWMIRRRNLRLRRTPNRRFRVHFRYTGDGRDKGYEREMATQEIAIIESTSKRIG